MARGGVLTGGDDRADDRAFLRVLCHELGTPVASMQALARALGRRRSPLSPDQQVEGLRLIEDHAGHMAALLDAVRTVADHLPDPVRSPTSTRLADLVQGAVHAAGIERLDVHIAPAVASVTVDASALRRILTNLLANAREHGRAPIELRAGRRHGLRLVITDHGDGMPSHVSAGAFRPGTPVGEGRRGLGLWIVTQLVTMLGGRVRVLDAPAGTRIEVVVPLGG